MSSARPFRIPALVIGLCALAGLAARASAGVSVGLTPATQNVTPGGDFDVFLLTRVSRGALTRQR